jgi:hypothetical protein
MLRVKMPVIKKCHPGSVDQLEGGVDVLTNGEIQVGCVADTLDKFGRCHMLFRVLEGFWRE